MLFQGDAISKNSSNHIFDELFWILDTTWLLSWFSQSYVSKMQKKNHLKKIYWQVFFVKIFHILNRISSSVYHQILALEDLLIMGTLLGNFGEIFNNHFGPVTKICRHTFQFQKLCRTKSSSSWKVLVHIIQKGGNFKITFCLTLLYLT